jgi:hypothetical protein
MDSNLTADDFHWLRKLKAAADAKTRPAANSNEYRSQAWYIRSRKPSSLGTFIITSKGSDALLDQDMRDAEDR